MIMNVKSGNCSEDCKWCSQSKFYNTDISIFPLVKYDAAVIEVLNAERVGVEMFGFVASGRRASKREIAQLSDTYKKLIETTPRIKFCASLGLLAKDDMQILFDAGVRRYHCNIETAPSHFKNLCTTHTIEEKVATIKAAQEVGMSICSGGIIGMSETMEQRIEMALFYSL